MSMSGYEVAGGVQASYSPNNAEIFGLSDYLPVTQGSELGVPPPTQIAGQTSPVGGGGGDNATTNITYGHVRAMSDPIHSPVFWSVALMAVGLIIIGHAALLSSKV